MPVAETQVQELPFQCSMMPVPRPREDPVSPTAQALRAEVAVTLPSRPFAGLGTSAWAVGNTTTAHGTAALIEHWNGTAWTLMPSPALGGHGFLAGVTALSGTSAWAVGGTFHRQQRMQTVTERWNGTSWALVPSPAKGLLGSVTATSARNAWAVG